MTERLHSVSTNPFLQINSWPKKLPVLRDVAISDFQLKKSLLWMSHES